MKALVVLLLSFALPVFAQTANGASGATTYGPGAHGSQPTNEMPHDTSADTSSDTTRSLDEAEKEGTAMTKTGGSTMTTGDDATATGGNGIIPKDNTPTRTARQELRTGTASTGGTGTTMDDAGDGSTSNTTGTGSMGSDSGQRRRR